MLPQVAAPRTARALPPHEAGLWLWSVAKLASAGDLLEARGFCVQDTYPTIDSRSEVYQFNKDGQVKLHFESAIHALHPVPSQPAVEHLYYLVLPEAPRTPGEPFPAALQCAQPAAVRRAVTEALALALASSQVQLQQVEHFGCPILAVPFWLHHCI